GEPRAFSATNVQAPRAGTQRWTAPSPDDLVLVCPPPATTNGVASTIGAKSPVSLRRAKKHGESPCSGSLDTVCTNRAAPPCSASHAEERGGLEQLCMPDGASGCTPRHAVTPRTDAIPTRERGG